MLIVSSGHVNSEERAFYVGDGRIIVNNHVRNLCDPHNTPLIQADGDELEVIRRQFTGIPMSNSRVVRWRGDISKFILENIEL